MSITGASLMAQATMGRDRREDVSYPLVEGGLRENCHKYGPMLQECCKHVKPVAYWTRPPHRSTSSAVCTGKRVYTSYTAPMARLLHRRRPVRIAS
jgi:hypothetical protein